jgi:hypothetical protein
MFELDLSRCPICQTTRGLVRQIREVQGQHFIWYECPECSSALMWLGEDRWIYQQIGRTDRQYLLKRPLTAVELQALSVATPPVSAAPTYYSPQSEMSDEVDDGPEEIDAVPAPTAPPATTGPAAVERSKGVPRSLVMAVAIIALLFIVAAIAIIATQL